MRHEIQFEKQIAKGSCEKLKREITFLAYGDQDKNGFSAMSKTVALTIGHAAVLLLNGTFFIAFYDIPTTSYQSCS